MDQYIRAEAAIWTAIPSGGRGRCNSLLGSCIRYCTEAQAYIDIYTGISLFIVYKKANQWMLPQIFYTTLSEAKTGISFTGISFLTFQAVVQVFLICLSGFWAAQNGLLSNEGVKIISRLNVDLFTPALIFSKLASSLSLKKLLEVIIIPILYALTTLVSYISSIIVSKWLNLTESESNFVIAMSVFGNSNSLPVSLTLALAYSLPNLEWDDIVDDTPDKIASRGLIYLLIFQQLGQMLRWSWGYNKLLCKQPDHIIFYDSIGNGDLENSYSVDVLNNSNNNHSDINSINNGNNKANNKSNTNLINNTNDMTNGLKNTSTELGDKKINLTYRLNNLNSSSSVSSDEHHDNDANISTHLLNGENTNLDNDIGNDNGNGNGIGNGGNVGSNDNILIKILKKFYSWMNPPLWSMLSAMIVASIPFLKNSFYVNDGFIQHTLSSAIRQLGQVSIPLILVVLGANLSPSSDIPKACPHYSRMILGSLLGRMVLPSLILLPIIVLSVKYIGLSIMQDPIFLITSFLLITSPPAIQLSQICQLNELYQKEMAGVLFYGYAILTLPVTIIVVVTCIEAMKWANPSYSN